MLTEQFDSRDNGVGAPRGSHEIRIALNVASWHLSSGVSCSVFVECKLAPFYGKFHLGFKISHFVDFILYSKLCIESEFKTTSIHPISKKNIL